MTRYCFRAKYGDYTKIVNDCFYSDITFLSPSKLFNFFSCFVFVCQGFRGICPKFSLTSRRNGEENRRLWLDVSVSVDGDVNEHIDKTDVFSWASKLRFKLILKDEKGQTLDFTFLPWPIQRALGQEFPRDDLLGFEDVYTLYIAIYEQPNDNGLPIPKKITVKKFR